MSILSTIFGDKTDTITPEDKTAMEALIAKYQTEEVKTEETTENKVDSENNTTSYNKEEEVKTGVDNVDNKPKQKAEEKETTNTDQKDPVAVLTEQVSALAALIKAMQPETKTTTEKTPEELAAEKLKEKEGNDFGKQQKQTTNEKKSTTSSDILKRYYGN